MCTDSNWFDFVPLMQNVLLICGVYRCLVFEFGYIPFHSQFHYIVLWYMCDYVCMYLANCFKYHLHLPYVLTERFATYVVSSMTIVMAKLCVPYLITDFFLLFQETSWPSSSSAWGPDMGSSRIPSPARVRSSIQSVTSSCCQHSVS